MKEYFELRGLNETTYSNHELQAWLAIELSAKGKDARILDFGCGFGQNILALKRLGWSSVSGCDINPKALTHCASEGLDVFDITTLDLALDDRKGSYDIIYTTHVLEHIPVESVIETLSKLKQLLKPGGTIVVAVPNAQSYTNAYWRYEDFTHHILYTAGSLQYILLSAGFSNPTLIDQYGLAGAGTSKRIIKKFFIDYYRLKTWFWKKILGSPTHIASENVYTWEVKMKAEA